jgi:hypothetical protein
MVIDDRYQYSINYICYTWHSLPLDASVWRNTKFLALVMLLLLLQGGRPARGQAAWPQAQLRELDASV